MLPVTVAFALPYALVWFASATFAHTIGLVPLAFGLGVLLVCVRDFHVSGKGTLAPWSPPERLVVVGLYRYSRSPVYSSSRSVKVLLLRIGPLLRTRP